MLALFYTQSQRQALQQITASQEAPPPSLAWRMRLQLAWAQRQAQPDQALNLIDRLCAEPLPPGVPPQEADMASARSSLMKAEIQLLLGDVAAARESLSLAQSQFEALRDSLGLADAHFLRFYIAADCGNGEEMGEALTLAIMAAKGDPARETVFRATRARAAIFHNAIPLAGEHDDGLPPDVDDLPAMESAAVADYLGMRAGMDGQYSQALAHLSRAHEFALDTGQQRRAITIATNLGHTYSRMGEIQTALHWLTQAIELARRCAWPGLVSLCLAHMGEAQRRLGRHLAARASLQECLSLCMSNPMGRTAALALLTLGESALDQGDNDAALQAFNDLLDRTGQARDVHDLHIKAHLGLARARLNQAQYSEAHEHIEQGLELARRLHRHQEEVEALSLKADAARTQRERDASRYSAADVVNLYMDALRQAERIPNNSPTPELFEATAHAIAQCGGHERAYHLLERSIMELKRSQASRAALARQALRLHHEIEQARAERAHLRTLAEAESLRSQHLATSLQVLHHLAGVGRAITHELDPLRIHDVLSANCIELLGAPCSTLWLMDGIDGNELRAISTPEGSAEAAQVPRETLRRCISTGRDLMLDALGNELETGDAHGLTFAIVSPLICADRVLGAVTYRCASALPLDTQQLLIWRSLCGYTAVALDNALAQQRATALQHQLMAKERIQALSTLVASVAHELNTPIGNCRLVASTLQEKLTEVANSLEQQKALRRSDWVSYCQELSHGLALVERSMARADSLISSFKQFAARTEFAAPQHFGLRTLCDRVIQAMAGKLKERRISCVNRVPQGLTLHSHPQALSQVLEIFLDNAIKHAYPEESAGLVVLSAERNEIGGGIRLLVTDNGKGISSAIQHRIFEPFFGNRLGKELSGLGLSISHHLVHGLLGGEITVSSRPGQGCSFCVEIPRHHPASELPRGIPLESASS
jgi:signal transduction histidine kinase/tetratricopeptide (TPR) repeat protein